jgi:hypothetical protein
MNSIIAFAIVTAIILGSMGFGFLAVRRIKMTPQELISLRCIKAAYSVCWSRSVESFFLVLYLTVQLTGIQILLEIAGYGSVQIGSKRR